MSGKEKYKTVALDSNLFIYQFEDCPKFFKYSSKIFQRLETGSLRGITSIISLIEVLSYPAPTKVINTMKKEFFNVDNLNIINVEKNIAELAAQLRRKYKIRLPDSVQLATALVHKANIFITNDKRLKKFKEIPVILLGDKKFKQLVP